MKKRLSILLALSMLFVGVFVQAAAATWATGDASDPTCTTTELSMGEGVSKTVDVSFTIAKNKSGNGPSTGSFYAVSSNSDIATVETTSVGQSSATSSAAGTAAVTYTVAGVAAGETTVKVGLSESSYVEISVTVTEAATPVISGLSTTELTLGTPVTDLTVQLGTDDYSLDSLTWTVAEASSGMFSNADGALAIADGVITCTPVKVGTGKLTITATHATSQKTATKTLDVTIKGGLPVTAIKGLPADGDVDDTAAFDADYDYSSGLDIGKYYDGKNNVFYVGKNVGLNGAQTTGTTSPLVIHVYGLGDGLNVKASITPSGSGLTATPEVLNTFDSDLATAASITDTTYYKDATVTLSGTAKAKGTYTLELTATNAETTRQSKPQTFKFKFKIEDVPTFNTVASTKTTVTWGKEFGLTVTAKNVDAAISLLAAATTADDDGVYVTNMGGVYAFDQGEIAGADAIEAAVGSFTAEATDGETGTTRTFEIKGTWNPGSDSSLTVKEDGDTAIFALKAQKGSGKGAVYQVLPVTLTFKAGTPTITVKTFDAFAYGTKKEQGSGTAIASATGMGTLTWDYDSIDEALPLGLKCDQTATDATQAASDNKDTSTLYIMGTPIALTPEAGTKVTLKVESDATDPAATATASAAVKVTDSSRTAPALTEGDDYNVLPEGYVAKGAVAFTAIDTAKTGNATTLGTAYDIQASQYAAVQTEVGTGFSRDPAEVDGEIELFAEPGPIKWSASGLPTNVQLVPDKNDTRFAYLQFKDTAKGFSAGTTIKETTDSAGDTTYSSPYTITITNPYTETAATTLTGDLVVWDKPSVSALSKTALTVDKDFSATLTVANTPTEYEFKVYDTGVAASGLELDDTTTYTVSGGESELAWTASTRTLAGQLDRIPQVVNDNSKTINGFKVEVTPKNFYNAGETDFSNYTKTFYVTVKGVKPKLDNATLSFTSDGGSETIKTSAGTPDITMTSFITQADAKKLFGYTGTTSVDLSTKNYGLQFAAGTGDAAGTGTITYDGGTTYAFKNLPVTVTATNNEGSVSKTYKVTVEGDDPYWTAGASNPTVDAKGNMNVLAGLTLKNDIVYTATITEPYEIKVSPMTKNGLTVTSNDKVITITGMPTAGKETKTAFTLTATNLSTKQKAVQKLTVVGLAAPVISTTGDKLTKEVQLGKKISIKPSAKGSKTITWDFADDSETSQSDIEALGLTFDSTKGAITGTPTTTTTDASDQYTYLAKNVTLQAENASLEDYVAAGDIEWDTVTFALGVKGAKTKVTTKNITILKGETGDALSIATSPTYDAAGAGMTFTATGLPTGIEIAEHTGVLTIDDRSSLVATKGTTATVTVNNLGTEAKGKVKFIIHDATPEINDVSGPSITAQEKAKVTTPVAVSVTDETCTGDTKIKWAIKTAPKKSQAKIKASGNGKTATLTITVPKNLKNTDDADITETVVITATNTKTKEVDDATVEYTITPVPTASTATAEDATFDAVADKTSDATAEEKAATGEGEVKFGKTRTAPTAAQLGAVQKVLGDGYVIAAVLPEIEVTAEGQYDFEVDLDEKVAAGAELVWFAFPESGKETEDDEIVDFYTKAGEDTKVVPEDHVLVVSPWLNAEVKYEPVIAVKVDAAEAEAVDAESVKEAAEEQAAE